MDSLSSTNKGLVAGAVLLSLASVFYFVLQWLPNGMNQFVLYVVFAAGIFWSVFSYARKVAAASPKTNFTQGFKAFVVMTLMMVVFTFVYYRTHPQILNDAIRQNNAIIAQTGQRTPGEIAENEKKLRSVFMPMMISITTMKYLIIGVLTTVIFSVLLRKQPS